MDLTYRRPPTPIVGLVGGLGGVALVTWLIDVVGEDVNELSLTVCYPLLVLAVSGVSGVWPGLVTAVASAAAVNWFFIAPVHTLSVSAGRDWVSLGVLAATAIITGHLAAGFRRQRAEAEERRRDAELLAEMAGAALGGIGPGPPGPGVAEAAARALGAEWCRIELGPENGAASAPVTVTPSPEGFAVPLSGGGRPLGLLIVGPARPEARTRWATPGFAEAVAGLAAVAVERGRLLTGALEAESLRRSDELKTALLHGVSHEFRTPLTAIRTAADTLATTRAPDGGAELLAVLAEETARLDGLVGNLLDLSRLEAGALVARMDWCAPAEIAAGAIDAAAPLLTGEVVLDVPDTLPLVRADPVLCERILVNLLHNAVRHGRPPIRMTGEVRDGRTEIAVSDGGAGLRREVAPVVLDPFTSAGPGGGTGVGLALARGLADAQGAALRAPGAGGSRFVLSFPPAPVPLVS